MTSERGKPVEERRGACARSLVLAALCLLGVLVPDMLSGQQDFADKIIRRVAVRADPPLKRISQDELLLRLGSQVRIGEEFDRIAISDATKTLWLTGLFSHVGDPEVKTFEDGVEVVFSVREKPLVSDLEFVVEDSSTRKSSIAVKTLEEAISTKSGKGLSPYALPMDVQQIIQTYQDEGYIFVEVRHVLRERDDGAHVMFLIKEGPRVRIHDVSFVGNRTVDTSTLRDLMLVREKDWFFGFFRPGYYNPAELERDLDKLGGYYKSLGFFDVLVALDDTKFEDGNRRMELRIRIDEGPRYTFTHYEAQGNEIFSSSTLLELTQARQGQFFSAEKMEQDRKEILKYYKDRAYIDATVTPFPVFPQKGTTVRVVFNIKEGHEIYIDRVHVRGNDKTRDEVIRRELEFYPGEKVNWFKQQKSRSNLARLRFFRDIRYEMAPGSSRAANRRDVIVRVDEEATGRLLIGFGVTSGFGVIGNFAITKRNFDFTDLPDSIYDVPDSFTGAGQTLNIALQPGTRRSLYQFSFTEPYLFETRNSLTIAGSASKIFRRDYDEDRLSFRPSLGHALDFDRDLVFTIGARVEEIEISDIDRGSAPDVFDAEGFTTVIAARSRIDYDKVLYEPLEGAFDGHREWLEYEYAGDPLGGQVDFSKVEGSLALYYPIYVHEEGRLHHVISLYSRLGAMEGHHNSVDEIPIFERFFLGGPNSVRGFRYRGLGPHYKKDALGGTAQWWGNAEYSFPLFQKFVRGVLFFDYGNLAVEPSQFMLDEMRYAAGAGIRMNFPFLGAPLPIGLYFGDAIKKEEFDREKSILFTIGAPF